ncbi:MAG TPA: M48 family metalloprotease [Allosphingosinicella sp.]|nr:M48 family metalloprotease [Allosphingosinicella sp.]
MNRLRTLMLLAALTALFMGLGFTIGGARGALVALVVAAAMNLITFWNADRIVLSMHGAKEVTAGDCPQLVGIVHDLAARAGLPSPRVYLIDSPHPNAFATGRDPAHAAVAATTGLLAILSREEVAAVMAHELGHVRNRDTLVMTMTATIAGAISMLANFGYFFRGEGSRANPLAMIAALLLAPFAAMLVQLAISRTREYGADRAGAEICGDPRALASALAKLHEGAARTPSPVAARVPAAASLYIVPSGGRDSLFSTHPDTANRIALLHEMAAIAAPPASTAPAEGRRRASALDPLGRRA